jgi:mRNA interferase RelE/StbE
MAYAIEYVPTAWKELTKLPANTQRRLLEAIEGLKTQPYPPGVKHLHGELRGLYRIRVGAFRVIYEVHQGRMLILIVEVGNRKETYR